MQLQKLLRGVFCITSQRSGRFGVFQRQWERFQIDLPVQNWPAVDGFSAKLQDDVPALVEAKLVAPAGLPAILVKKEWKEKWRREKKWFHVRRSREAPGRKHGGWLFDLDLTRGAFARGLSHLRLWEALAKDPQKRGAYLIVEEKCRFFPDFCRESLEARLEAVPSGWDFVFLSGTDLLGNQAPEVASGVRGLYPWFRAGSESTGSAYLITQAGARRALRMCAPLRWRWDCQLVGYHSSTDYDASTEDRIFQQTKRPAGYWLHPPVVRESATAAAGTQAGAAGRIAQRRNLRGGGTDVQESEAEEGLDESNADMSPEEQRLIDELDAMIAWSMRLTDKPMPVGCFSRIYHPDRQIEGHSNMVPEARQVLRELASDPRVQTIFEVGFNGGHSSLRWLFHSQAHVYAFDLGEHHYSRPASMWLANKFPGRLDLFWGDSLVKVPEFHEENPDMKAEIIFIDGGHSTDLARADLKHFYEMVNLEYNRVIMDDTFLDCVKVAWDEMIEAGKVEELAVYQGTLPCGNSYGFSVGRYVAVSGE